MEPPNRYSADATRISYRAHPSQGCKRGASDFAQTRFHRTCEAARLARVSAGARSRARDPPCVRRLGDIHHRATNFHDKYFTDGHYAGAAVFVRYKLWMTMAGVQRRACRPERNSRTGWVAKGGGGGGAKGLTPVKFAGNAP